MPPSRIRFLRHAEEHGVPGVDLSGASDVHGLTVRGWQRAGALARYLVIRDAAIPSYVFASKVAHGSETRRPQQTVAPLMDLLGRRSILNIEHTKPEVSALMHDVLALSGEVIVVWEHSRLPNCVALLPSVTAAPTEWPAHRYDLVWIARPNRNGWTIESEAQALLSGDENAV